MRAKMEEFDGTFVNEPKGKPVWVTSEEYLSLLKITLKNKHLLYLQW